MVTNGSEGNRRRQYMRVGGYKWEIATAAEMDELYAGAADARRREANREEPATTSGPLVTPADARKAGVERVLDRWADTDAREARETLEWEAQFSSSKTAALEVERATALRQPSVGARRAADEPGLGVRATSAAWRLSRGILGPSNNPDRPSQTPSGRRERYLRSLVAAGKFPDVQSADEGTSKRGSPR